MTIRIEFLSINCKFLYRNQFRCCDSANAMKRVLCTQHPSYGRSQLQIVVLKHSIEYWGKETRSLWQLTQLLI